MKKIFLIVLAILIIFQTGSTISYAEKCNIPVVDMSELDTSKMLLKDTWLEQDIGDKHVSMVRFEEIVGLPLSLKQTIRSHLEDAIRTENKKINEDTIKLMWKAFWNYITDKTNEDIKNQKLQKDFIDKYSTEYAQLLSNEEFNEAVMKGAKSSAKIVMPALLIEGSTLLYKGTKGAIKEVVKGVATGAIKEAAKGTMTGAVKEVVKDVATGAVNSAGWWLIAFAIVDTAITKGVNWHYTRVSENLQREILKLKNLYEKVTQVIVDHQWQGNNLLLLSTYSKNNCLNAYAKFVKVDGIKYKEMPYEIDENFAIAECRFLGYYNDGDCENKAIDAINCNWSKKNSPYGYIKCPKNPYAKKVFDYT